MYLLSYVTLRNDRYVTVDESELFYFFVKSDRNPKDDPFMLWLTGGPACSSFSGLAYEIGKHIHFWNWYTPCLKSELNLSYFQVQ